MNLPKFCSICNCELIDKDNSLDCYDHMTIDYNNEGIHFYYIKDEESDYIIRSVKDPNVTDVYTSIYSESNPDDYILINSYIEPKIINDRIDIDYLINRIDSLKVFL